MTGFRGKRNHNDVWTEDMIARMRSLASEKYPASKIAELLNGEFKTSFSRNAIIGKVNRLRNQGITIVLLGKAPHRGGYGPSKISLAEPLPLKTRPATKILRTPGNVKKRETGSSTFTKKS